MPVVAASIQPLAKTAPGLRGGLDHEPPELLSVGRGTALALSGWCFHSRQSITRLEIECDGDPLPVELHGIQRRDLRERFPRETFAEWSGFAAVIPILSPRRSHTMRLRLRAHLRDGRTAKCNLASIRLQPELESGLSTVTPRPESARGALLSARVAICMTTYNPRIDLLQRQLDSLRAQTERDWVCIICDDHSRADSFAAIRAAVADDPRFALYRQPSNIGFYRNFEQCLGLVPSECEFVALADQDDVWHADKLAALQAGFGPKTTLVYSDARIVSDRGACLSPTYWTTRQPNRGDFAALLLANTVTGAAAMLRRSALDAVLPFPPAFGAAFHDHWLALSSQATGEIEFLDRPLYDYVQHGGNVIGHVAPAALPIWTRIWRWAKFFWPLKLPRNIKVALGNGRTHFFDNWLRIRQLACALRLRTGGELTDDRRRALDRALAPWALAVRGCAHPRGVSTTVGMEFHLLHAWLWTAYMRAKRAVFAPRVRQGSR